MTINDVKDRAKMDTINTLIRNFLCLMSFLLLIQKPSIALASSVDSEDLLDLESQQALILDDDTPNEPLNTEFDLVDELNPQQQRELLILTTQWIQQIRDQ